MFSFSEEGISVKTVPGEDGSFQGADLFFKNDTVAISKTYGGRGFYVQISNESCSVTEGTAKGAISELPFSYRFIDYENQTIDIYDGYWTSLGN